MLSSKHLFKSFLFLFFMFASAAGFAQSQQKLDRIKAAYMLAYGREPVSGEITFYVNQQDQTIGQYLNLLSDYASRDKSFKRSLISKSYVDAIGRKPNEGEINYWMNGSDLYYNLVKNHVAWLQNNPAEYEKVIRRSYQAVLNRQPSTGEINYWKGQGTLSYIVLVGCHEEFKRRMGSGNSTNANISGTSSGSLTVIPLSSNVATEAKSASGIQIGGNVIAAGGGNVIAAGGGNVIAAGGGNVVAAGGGN